MTKDLTVGSPLKRIIGFAFPLYLGMIFQQFYNIVDTVIVGRFLGVRQLAGVGSTGALNFFVMGFCMGVCSGFSIPIAQSFGAKKYSEMRKFTSNSLWLSAFFSVILTVATAFFCRPILVMMNTPEDIIEYAYIYILVIFIGIPLTFMYNVLAGIYRALGDSRSPLMFLILSSVLNIGLDLLMILVFKRGVEGPALATVISQGISGVISIIYMRKKYSILRMTEEERKPSVYHMKKLCYMGIPMGLQYSVTAIGSLIVQMAVNNLGSVVVAGVAAAQRLHGFLICPLEALGSTMASFTGQNMGARKFDRIGKGTRSACLCGIAASLLTVVLVQLFGRPLVSIFLDAPDPEVITYAFRFLQGTSSCYFLLTFVNVVRFSIQGMGYSVVAIISGVLEMIARTFVGLSLAPIFGFEVLRFAHPFAWLLADFFLIPTFFICKKKIQERGMKVER